MSYGRYKIIAAPEDKPPFPVDAEVLEEDTFLVISAPPVVKDPGEPLMKIMTKVIETRPQPPGSVLVRGKHPLRFLAIVYDFNEEPIWREEWVVTALKEIFRKAECRKVRSIGLPYLGNRHGSLEMERFRILLGKVLQETGPKQVERIWLVIPTKKSRKPATP